MKSLKQVISILVAMAKAKSTVSKSRNRVIKSQRTISKLLHERREMTSDASQRERACKNGDNTAIVPHGLDIDTLREESGSVIEFGLENEIDVSADVFMRRFHRQMMIQKQESFKRYQEMLERSNVQMIDLLAFVGDVSENFHH